MKLFRKKKTRGVISIFLVLILLPTMLFSAVLIDGSRMASARAMTQEAADLAASSTLASYNQELKDRYGLFAINNPEKVEEIYKESLAATLMASGLSDDQEYSEKIWDILKSEIGFGNPYKGQEFLNLYDFSVDSCKVEPLYHLANQSVLENQIVEHSKFRGVYKIADRTDLLAHLSEIKEKAQKTHETSQVMKEKMTVDENNGEADKKLKEMRDAATDLNNAIEKVESCENDYIDALKSEMELIRDENTDSGDSDSDNKNHKNQERDYNAKREALKAALDVVDDKARELYDKTKESEKEVEKAIKNLEKFIGNNQGKAAGNPDVEQMIKDAEDNIEIYNKVYLKQCIELYLEDTTLKKLKEDHSLGRNANTVMGKIDDAIRKYIDEMETSDSDEDEDEDEDDEDEEYFFYYLTGSEKTTEIDSAVGNSGGNLRYYKPALEEGFKYFKGKRWNPPNPTQEAAGQNTGDSGQVDKNFAEEQSGKNQDDSDKGGEAERGKVEDTVYGVRPSKNEDVKKDNKANGSGFYNDQGNLKQSINILDGSKDSILLQLAETARDDTLGLSYMFGTFKSRLTGMEKFSKAEAKNNKYIPKWRVHEGGEQNMRFQPKKDDKTVLRGELEYLVYGLQSDQANEDLVYATIYGERLINNMIAVYGVKSINHSCHAAAGAAASLSWVVPEPVFFWIFLTACAVAETYIDMNFLVGEGYKIPLIKTRDNVILDPANVKTNAVEKYGNPDDLKNGIFVTYEDYILILLIIKGKNTRLMRTADLIEMNMKQKQSDFAMTKAYTYIKADTNLSLRYLFGSTAPFQSEYEKNGITGRMKFNSTIYQGY